MPVESFVERTFVATIKRCKLERFALQALLQASHLFALALGATLGQMRDAGDAVQKLGSLVEELRHLLRLANETNEILAARWDKFPRRARPFYTPELRYRILKVKQELALSAEETARRFRVSVGTIERWQAEAMADADGETVGSLVKPEPPVRRFADVVRHLVQDMVDAGFGGAEMIAKVLGRAGWRMSRRSVSRIRKERRAPSPEGTSPSPERARAVRARHPGHVLLMDLTDIPTLFHILTLKLLVVFDAFSRMPLAARIFPSEPTAEQAVDLFTTATANHGKTPHLVTDQGSQFTAEVFREAAKAAGTKQRFGAVGKYGSIALVERFWRSLKNLISLRIEPPLTQRDAERRVALALVYYAYCRPHRALGGATPAEVHFGIRPEHLAAISPPRGRPGEVADDAPFDIAFLDPERRLPILIPKAA